MKVYVRTNPHSGFRIEWEDRRKGTHARNQRDMAMSDGEDFEFGVMVANHQTQRPYQGAVLTIEEIE